MRGRSSRGKKQWGEGAVGEGPVWRRSSGKKEQWGEGAVGGRSSRGKEQWGEGTMGRRSTGGSSSVGVEGGPGNSARGTREEGVTGVSTGVCRSPSARVDQSRPWEGTEVERVVSSNVPGSVGPVKGRTGRREKRTVVRTL